MTDQQPDDPLSELKQVLDWYANAVRVEVLEKAPPEPHVLMALRQRRDIKLRLLPRSLPNRQGGAVRATLSEYDVLIDGIVASVGAGNVNDRDLLPEANQRIQQQLDEIAGAADRWFPVWVTCAALGLASILGSFVWTAQADPPSWAWISVCLAGLGALLAACYTYASTSQVSQRSRWILVCLPLAVLVLAFVLPGVEAGDRAATFAVAGVVVVALAAGSAWLLSHQGFSRDGEWNSPISLDLLSASWVPPNEKGQVPSPLRALLVAAELERLGTRISIQGRRQQFASVAWATTFIVIGGSAALLSGAAGVQASQEQTEGVAVLAIVGAGLTALTTALNPGKRWEQARTLHLACQSLGHEVSVGIRLDLSNTTDHGRHLLEEVAVKYDALMGLPDASRLWNATDR